MLYPSIPLEAHLNPMRKCTLTNIRINCPITNMKNRTFVKGFVLKNYAKLNLNVLSTTTTHVKLYKKAINHFSFSSLKLRVHDVLKYVSPYILFPIV